MRQKLIGLWDAGLYACCGIDPDAAKLGLKDTVSHSRGKQGVLEDFAKKIIDQTREHVAAYKFNLGFYLKHIVPGIAALKSSIDYARDTGRHVILDFKVGDVGNTAEAYAEAAFFEGFNVDAVTLNGYLGVGKEGEIGEALAPFTADSSRGAFILAKTSNRDGGQFQDLTVMPSEDPLYEVVARAVSNLKIHNVGLVVGATNPMAIAVARKAAPNLPFLIPGIGAQGGHLEQSVRAACDTFGGGFIINSSRGIIHADDPGAAAKKLNDDIRAALGW